MLWLCGMMEEKKQLCGRKNKTAVGSGGEMGGVGSFSTNGKRKY